MAIVLILVRMGRFGAVNICENSYTDIEICFNVINTPQLELGSGTFALSQEQCSTAISKWNYLIGYDYDL